MALDAKIFEAFFQPTKAEKVPQKKTKPVMVYNKKTGKYAVYASAYYFINKYGLSNRVVLGRLNKDQVGRSGHWFYCYVDPVDSKITETRLY
jgi:hypothetical protein